MKRKEKKGKERKRKEKKGKERERKGKKGKERERKKETPKNLTLCCDIIIMIIIGTRGPFSIGRAVRGVEGQHSGER